MTSDDVRRAVADAVRDAVGIPPKMSCSCNPGTLPKTSSGKLQRRALCRERYLESAYTIGQG